MADASDPDHAATVSAIEGWPGELVVSAFTAAEAWHLLGIMSEFADATERETLLNLQAEAAGRITHQRQFC